MGNYNDFEKGAPTLIYNEGPQDWLFYDDFNDLNMSASGASASGLDKWSHLSTDSGNTALLSGTQGGGVLAMAYSTPTDEDVISIIGNSGIITGTNLVTGQVALRFGCRFQLADVSHNDLHIGLSIFDHSMAASAPADWVGFRCLASEGLGELNLVASKDSVVQMVDPVTTLADATWCRAFFEWTPITGNADSGNLAYVVHTNGSRVTGNLTVANCFPDDVWIAPLIAVQIEGTDGDTALFDWIYAHGIRAAYTDGTG